tara:strand:- start:374 stop:604 length:231 start_codon:yes stop_codon:yes gene_type:complete
MNYEFNDFRNKPEPPSWTNWQVPKELGWDYIVKMFLFLFGIPFLLFGAVFTPVGMLVNVIIIDYFIYISYRARGLL